MVPPAAQAPPPTRIRLAPEPSKKPSCWSSLYLRGGRGQSSRSPIGRETHCCPGGDSPFSSPAVFQHFGATGLVVFSAQPASAPSLPRMRKPEWERTEALQGDGGSGGRRGVLRSGHAACRPPAAPAPVEAPRPKTVAHLGSRRAERVP